jgi:uncharacterized membrane protein YeaQ/YmgE (transglycosylase-associated protein family)
MVDTILWLGLGVVAGALAVLAVHRTLPRDVWQWVGALVLGLIGGWLGGWLAGLIGLEAVSWLGSLIIAFLAATGVLLLLRKVGSRPKAA